jgi:thymidylate synthase
MNKLDKQYTDLLQDILDNGTQKKDRTGTGTLSVFSREIRHKMSDGFPLITTKKMYFKGVVTELIWFLQGRTDLRYLLENDCHIWDGDAYKKYLSETLGGCDNKWLKEKDGMNMSTGEKTKVYCQYPKEEFIERIKTDDEFSCTWGDLGKIYGKQWREWTYLTREKKEDIEGIDESICGVDMFDGYGYYRTFDQIANLIKDLKTNPDSRRLMVNAWNVGQLDEMTLPPCHYGFQCYTRELKFRERYNYAVDILGYLSLLDYGHNENQDDLMTTLMDEWNIPTRALSLKWNQRSVDTPLGLPFNIASYGLLLEILAKEVNMVPDELIGNLGDCHIYLNQIDGVKEQIGREYTVEERLKWMRENTSIKKSINVLQTRKLSDDLSMDDFFEPYNVPKRTREPFPLPTLKHMKTDAFYKSLSEHQSLYGHLDNKDFQIENYQSHSSIKFPLSN